MQINGWELFAHPLLLDQLERLTAAVEKLQSDKPREYRSSANFKLLAALHQLLFVTVPLDPNQPQYRQGGTLGVKYKRWFRAKFGNQRFQLFFRFDSKAKVIVFAWVNDTKTKRTYGSKNDAYAVFSRMLETGDPPDDWHALLNAAKTKTAVERLKKAKSSTEEK
jgi:toxin YhaV